VVRAQCRCAVARKERKMPMSEYDVEKTVSATAVRVGGASRVRASPIRGQTGPSSSFPNPKPEWTPLSNPFSCLPRHFRRQISNPSSAKQVPQVLPGENTIRSHRKGRKRPCLALLAAGTSTLAAISDRVQLRWWNPRGKRILQCLEMVRAL